MRCIPAASETWPSPVRSNRAAQFPVQPMASITPRPPASTLKKGKTPFDERPPEERSSKRLFGARTRSWGCKVVQAADAALGIVQRAGLGGRRGDGYRQRPDVGQDRRGGRAFVLQVEHPLDGRKVAILDGLATHGEFRRRVAPSYGDPPSLLILGLYFPRLLPGWQYLRDGLAIIDQGKEWLGSLVPQVVIEPCLLARAIGAGGQVGDLGSGYRGRSAPIMHARRSPAPIGLAAVFMSVPFSVFGETLNDNRIASNRAQVTEGLGGQDCNATGSPGDAYVRCCKGPPQCLARPRVRCAIGITP